MNENINDKKEENNIKDIEKINKIKINYINSPNAIKYIKKTNSKYKRII